jgi:ABC-type uncharacterized transport system involved in gliding motility auxiliary subunit
VRTVNRPRGFEFTLETLKGPVLALGALLLMAGLGSWLINGFDTPTRILLAAGILLIGVFVAIDPESVWGQLTGRGALYGGNTLLVGAAIIGILGLINVVGQNRHQRWDLTANKQYSLSDQTLNVVAELPQPVQLTAFYQDDDPRRQEIRDLLTEYETRSGGKVGVEFVDPDKQPARAQQAGIREYGTLVMTMGDRKQTVSGTRESDITTGLLRLTSTSQKKIYFLSGHNERRIDGFERDSYSQVKTALESDNYLVEPLVLAGSREIPQDAAVLVVAQPRNPLLDEEKQAITSYLDQGGKLMLLTQPHLPPSQAQVPLSDLVGRWNVEIGSAPVVEGNPQLSLPQEPLVPLIARYPSHKISEALGFTFYPTTTYINVPRDGQSSATITSFLQTSDRSWAETGQQVQFDEGSDLRGPLTIGVAIDDTAQEQPDASGGDDPEAKKIRVVIIGDADFASNAYLGLGGANRDFFVNAINWLAEEEQLISIRPKEQQSRNLFLSAAQQNLVLFSSALFLPLIVLAMGGFVWWSRR